MWKSLKIDDIYGPVNDNFLNSGLKKKKKLCKFDITTLLALVLKKSV